MRREVSRGETGLSLVEVTIILLVLMVLTGVLAPSMTDFVNDARMVKVKEDCEVIGVSIMRFLRDNGPCFKFSAALACTRSNRIELLVGDGPATSTLPSGSVTATALLPTTNSDPSGLDNWNDDDLTNANAVDTFEDQLVTNTPGYLTISIGGSPPNFRSSDPKFNMGWRGAYLAPQIEPDPWGNRYMVNSIFLAVATDGTSGIEGGPDNGWNRDTFCISSGPNRIYQTSFPGDANSNIAPGGTRREGDDFIYVISGASR